MRASATVFIFIFAFSVDYSTQDFEANSNFERTSNSRVKNTFRQVVQCGRELGPTRCVSAFGLWRARRAVINMEADRPMHTSLKNDVENFPWELYTNASDENIYSELCDATENVLRYKQLVFDLLPGYKLELNSNGNGSLNIDVIKHSTISGRGMKSLQKQFYKIVPYLLVPGLIMSAILPFVLPMLKLMTVGVGMINNMALTGAIFTLLRNNAFNDNYEQKVIYVNSGYKTKKRTTHDDDIHHNGYSINNNFPGDIYDGYYNVNSHHTIPVHENIDEVETNVPSDSDWISQYYGEQQIYNQIKRKDETNHPEISTKSKS